MPEFLKAVISDMDLLLSYDDLSFIGEVKARRNLKVKGLDNYEEAYQIFKDVLNRRKRYAILYEHRLSLRTVSRREKELEKIKGRFEEAGREINLRIDYRGEIRPIGIDLTKIFNLLNSPIILDENTGKPLSLKEYSKADYSAFSRYQILFYVFADREKLRSGKYGWLASKIKSELEAELERLEEA
jgi:hypothetical protein